MNRQAFGRRNIREPHRERRAAQPAVPVAEPAPSSRGAAPSHTDPVDEELRSWKASRGLKFPLRPFSLMASLCFGIASYALPQSLNEILAWPLYALAAASLYVGLSKRFGKGDADRASGAQRVAQTPDDVN